MDLWDRFLWLAIGCFIGFVLGYIVRSLQEIKARVEHVEETVTENEPKKSKWDRNDDGLLRHPLLLDLVLLIVVGMTVFASFATAKVNNELQEVLACNTEFNNEQAVALRSRDRAVSNGIQSEIELWRRYERLYKKAKEYPERIPALQEKLNRAIIQHRKALQTIQVSRELYDYANPNILQDCEGETK
jgi:hypothetical protein